MSDAALPTDRPTRELDDLYREARERLAAVVAGALRRGAHGTARYYQQQQREVQAILDDLAGRTPSAIVAGVVGAYNPVLHAVDQVLGDVIRFGGVHQDAVDVLAINMRDRLDPAVRLVGRRATDAFRRAALREVALGIAAGATTDDVARALRERLVREGVTDATTGFVDRAGRRWPLDVYCRMVSRTTTREAQSAALANRMTEHGDDLVQISDHNTTTPICKPFEGGTFSLTGKTRGYKVLVRLPPFHPGCLHVMTPAVVSLDEWERELAEFM